MSRVNWRDDTFPDDADLDETVATLAAVCQKTC
jgi:hypothetical protein